VALAKLTVAEAHLAAMAVVGGGGKAYGDLTLRLEAGSGGGGAEGFGLTAPGGGGGGGAVEIGAIGNISLTGSVLANGGAGGNSNPAGGGGAGGGVRLHGDTIHLTCSARLSAVGGSGGNGGGGGRIYVAWATVLKSEGDPIAKIQLSGGDRFAGTGVLTPADLASQAEVLDPPAAQLAFLQQPTNTSVGATLSAVTVEITDACGQPVTNSTATVTIDIGSNPGRARLGGTLTVAAVKGVATFSDLTLDKAAQAYTLTAASAGLGGDTSSTFDVAKGQPVITWSNPADLSCDTTLSVTQLNATVSLGGVSIDGKLVYTPPYGASLPVGQQQQLSVIFAPADPRDYLGATASVSINVVDHTPPILTCPGNQSFNATAPNGAIVNYSKATATDSCGGTVTTNYSQNAGTLFPIGDTTVMVTATDASGNQATPCSFKVHVKGSLEQITDLMGKINALPSTKAPNKTALLSKLQVAAAALTANNKSVACSAMQDFINLVSAQQSKKLLTTADAQGLTNDAVRIRAVIGCR
jgi:hypothetical protein